MGFSFKRPTGAGADVLELEYVSALLQTNITLLRTDGSIKAEDIALFLTSRYGLKVTPDQVQTHILAHVCCSGPTIVDATIHVNKMDPTYQKVLERVTPSSFQRQQQQQQHVEDDQND